VFSAIPFFVFPLEEYISYFLVHEAVRLNSVVSCSFWATRVLLFLFKLPTSSIAAGFSLELKFHYICDDFMTNLEMTFNFFYS
jgi:hypothetical protein